MLPYLTILALIAPSAVVAQPVARPMVETSHDGIPIAYRSDLQTNGNVEITGRMLDTNDAFRLVVRPSGRVVGRVGGNPVRFVVAKKVRDGLVDGLRAKTAPPQAVIEPASLLTVAR